MISTANPVLRHRALLLGTSAALALVMVQPAAAQCVVEPDNIITCSGDNDAQQTLNSGGGVDGYHRAWLQHRQPGQWPGDLGRGVADL